MHKGLYNEAMQLMGQANAYTLTSFSNGRNSLWSEGLHPSIKNACPLL